MIAIDNTALAMYKDCPKKYQLGILRGYRPKSTSAPLSFGIAIHNVLELFDAQTALGIDRETALAAAIRRSFELSTEGFGTDSRRTRVTLIRALVWYEQTYRNDPMQTVVLPNGKPAVELSFRVELPVDIDGSPVIYSGHIDKLVRYNGQIFAVERKHTVSTLGDYYYARYVFSSQISGYVLAVRTAYGENIGGAIIDAVQLGESFCRFGRRVAHRVPEHIDEWLNDTIYWIDRLATSLRDGRWPHNTEACMKYGGCQFREVCFSNPAVRQAILNADFRIEHWDPLRIRGEEE